MEEEEPEELPPLATFIADILREVVDKVVAEPEQSVSGLLATRDILEQILDKTELNVQLRERFGEKCARHNQYGMFNMLDKIPDFDIGPEMFAKLAFREHLVIGKLSSAEGTAMPEPVGGICVDVQTAEGRQPMRRQMEEYETKLIKFLDAEGCTDHTDGGSNPDRCSTDEGLNDADGPNGIGGYSKFLVHVSSQFDVDGINAGSTVTSWVDRNLHTLEELRKEFIVESPESVNEKSLYTALKKKWYYVKHTASIEDIDDRKLYSVAKARDYISEGANIILLRYLAVTGYMGKLELSCSYINGDLCRNIYECFGPEAGRVNGRKMDVCKIKRTIIEECGIQQVSMTVMTLNGQVIKHEWMDCDYVLHVNPKININNESIAECKDLLLQDSWEDDMEMFSKYLDQQEICMFKNRSYMADHPELRNIVTDYVNTILLLRPPDVMAFTYKFFTDVMPLNLPRNDYFE